ncbi:hypothetical protein AGLY_012737 [Aphis glycines]|uniref:Transposable element P transposase n=1 Tax=Aphis glycines TaxID=307491 RepID=A0A6G0T8H5_APHGL|nr:hypothetical protein AGLY_012737 [Aphis glycines]
MTNTSRPMLRYGSVPSINLPSTAFLKSLSLKINKKTKLKKTPTKCSPMHMFKKFGSFGHSPKRQTSNIFTVDKEIHDATTLSDELTGIKKLNRSLINNMLGSVIQKEATDKKGQRYEETEKSFALGLYYHSPATYRFMKSFLCLPDIRSLRRWLEGLDVSCGINQNILNILKLKFQTAPIREKLVSIIVDEMSLKQLITYNSQNDTFYGYEDFGSDIFEDLKTLKQGNQVLVVMVKSLILSLKQILGFFIVNVIICDQGSNNLKMRKLFNVTKEKPYITFNNENVFFMHDSPHLLKSVRNNLKKYTFENANELYSWKDIEDFYKVDCNNKPRLASKLKKINLDLPPFSLMSNSVSAGILTLVSFNKLSAKAAYTAKFVKFFNDLFDVFNSIKLNEPIVLKRPLTKNSLHWDFFKEALIFLSEGNLPPCIVGWQENIICVQILFKELNEKYGIEYLLMRRLTQDCIESLFSVLRAKGGNNLTPDASKIQSAIRMNMCNMLISPSNNANCEKDASEFLALTKDIKTSTITLDRPYNESEEIYNIDDYYSYVTGWVCSQLDHQPCIEKLATKNKDANTKFDLAIKEYEGCSLLYPLAKTLEFTKHVSALFHANIENLILKKKCNLKKDLTLIINHVCKRYSLSICKDFNTTFLDKFLNVSINCYVKKCNDLFNQYKCSKNKKLKKVVHVYLTNTYYKTIF